MVNLLGSNTIFWSLKQVTKSIQSFLHLRNTKVLQTVFWVLVVVLQNKVLKQFLQVRNVKMTLVDSVFFKCYQKFENWFLKFDAL